MGSLRRAVGFGRANAQSVPDSAKPAKRGRIRAIAGGEIRERDNKSAAAAEGFGYFSVSLIAT